MLRQRLTQRQRLIVALLVRQLPCEVDDRRIPQHTGLTQHLQLFRVEAKLANVRQHRRTGIE